MRETPRKPVANSATGRSPTKGSSPATARSNRRIEAGRRAHERGRRWGRCEGRGTAPARELRRAERRSPRLVLRLGAIASTLHIRGEAPGCLRLDPAPTVAEGCARPPDPGKSVARVWDDEMLERSATTCLAPPSMPGTCFTCRPGCGMPGPRTTRGADGMFVTENLPASDAGRSQDAISYAAYQILAGARHGRAWRRPPSSSTRRWNPLPSGRTSHRDGDSPAALGNRIAAAGLA